MRTVPDFTLSDLKDQGTTFNSVTINSHGNASEFGIGADNVNVNTDVSSLEAGLKGKQVYINACNVGNGEGLITNFSMVCVLSSISE